MGGKLRVDGTPVPPPSSTQSPVTPDSVGGDMGGKTQHFAGAWLVPLDPDFDTSGGREFQHRGLSFPQLALTLHQPS